MARGTLRDIAKDTGFSIATVSGVLNSSRYCCAKESTRVKIREAAKRLGYRPNYFGKALRNQQSFLIGLVGHMLTPENHLRQYRGIQNALREKGYVTVLIDSQDDQDGAIRELMSIHVDGLVISYDRDDVPCVTPEIVDIPSVVLASKAAPGMCTLVIDKSAATKRMTQYLIGLGHRRICFVTRVLGINQTKYEGYVQAMQEGDLDAEIRCFESLNEDVMGCGTLVENNPDVFKRATAVVATGDQVAVEVIRGLNNIGLSVPGDCSVAGYSDNWIAISASPPLTTVHVPREEIGPVAAGMLLGLISGKQIRGKRIVPEIVVRQSTSAPRSH